MVVPEIAMKVEKDNRKISNQSKLPNGTADIKYPNIPVAKSKSVCLDLINS
jgi:hypothetical protein